MHTQLGKAQCYVDAGAKEKAAALVEAGFREEARFAEQLRWGDDDVGVLAYAKA